MHRSAPQAERVRDVAFVGLEFSQTRSTFMSEPYEVPPSLKHKSQLIF